jgi:hypothetical protein
MTEEYMIRTVFLGAALAFGIATVASAADACFIVKDRGGKPLAYVYFGG